MCDDPDIAADPASRGEIAFWGLAELAAEHGDEGAGAGIARVEGSPGDFFSGGQKLHGVQQAQLLAPLVESHFRLREEKALDGALACATMFAEGFQGAVFRGVGKQNFCDAHGTGVVGMRQLQGDGVGGFELIDDDFDNASVCGIFLL